MSAIKKKPKITKINNRMNVLDGLEHEAVAISKRSLKFSLYTFRNNISKIFKVRESLGIALATFVPLITTKSTNYSDFLKIPGSVWYSVIFILCVISILNLLLRSVEIIVLYFRGNCFDVEDFVDNYIFCKKSGNIFSFFNFIKNVGNKKKGGDKYGKESYK